MSEATNLIKRAMSEQNLNQKELAARAGRSEPLISRCLRGKMLLTRETAEAIETALGLDHGHLVELAFLDWIESWHEEWGGYEGIRLRLQLCARRLW